MTKNRISPKAGFVYPSVLEKGPNGRALCRWCKQEVPRGRRTFCGDPCVHEWKIRTNPGYVREQVFKRDKGVCAKCKTDVSKLERILKRLVLTSVAEDYWDQKYRRRMQISTTRRLMRRARLMKLFNSRHKWIFPKKFDPTALYSISIYFRLTSTWQADHIIPVVEGGGECGLDNYRTLCTQCHKQETKALAGRLAAARKEKKNEPT